MDKKKNEETMKEAYERVFDYDPTIEEVDARYPKDFDEWLMADELV